MRLVPNRKLVPGMVLLLPFGRTATITEVKVGRSYVEFRTEHGKSRVSVYDESQVQEKG